MGYGTGATVFFFFFFFLDMLSFSRPIDCLFPLK